MRAWPCRRRAADGGCPSFLVSMYLPTGLSLDGLGCIIHRPTQACYFCVSFHPLQYILIGLRVNKAELKRRLAAPESPFYGFHSFLSTCQHRVALALAAGLRVITACRQCSRKHLVGESTLFLSKFCTKTRRGDRLMLSSLRGKHAYLPPPDL